MYFQLLEFLSLFQIISKFFTKNYAYLFFTLAISTHKIYKMRSFVLFNGVKLRMLYIVTRGNRHHYQKSLSKAFQKREFKIPLFQEEVMPFDNFPEAVYFVGVDESIGICGLARLLPTTGFHICSSLSPGGVPSSPQLWELNAIHFFLPHNLDFLRCESTLALTVDRFYHELFEALYQFACQKNIQQILVLDHHLIIQDLWHVGWPLIEVKGGRHHAISFPLSLKLVDISPASYQQFLINRR
jgi:N-acyl-L-homoserine lactone synthetase